MSPKRTVVSVGLRGVPSGVPSGVQRCQKPNRSGPKCKKKEAWRTNSGVKSGMRMVCRDRPGSGGWWWCTRWWWCTGHGRVWGIPPMGYTGLAWLKNVTVSSEARLQPEPAAQRRAVAATWPRMKIEASFAGRPRGSPLTLFFTHCRWIPGLKNVSYSSEPHPSEPTG